VHATSVPLPRPLQAAGVNFSRLSRHPHKLSPADVALGIQDRTARDWERKRECRMGDLQSESEPESHCQLIKMRCRTVKGAESTSTALPAPLHLHLYCFDPSIIIISFRPLPHPMRSATLWTRSRSPPGPLAPPPHLPRPLILDYATGIKPTLATLPSSSGKFCLAGCFMALFEPIQWARPGQNFETFPATGRHNEIQVQIYGL